MEKQLKPQHLINAGIPCLPMVRILQQYAKAKGINYNRRDWDSIALTFQKYVLDASRFN